MKSLKKLALISLISIVNISTKANPQESLGLNLNFGQKTPTASPINPFIDQIMSQLDAIHGILSDLSAIISDNQIKNIKDNKKEVLSNIQILMREIEEKRNVIHYWGHTNQDTVAFTLRFTRAVMDHITQALNQGCKNFPQFDSETLIKKSTKKVTDKMIQNTIIANHKRLKNLQKAANNAGLRWYNKVYRKFDRWMLQPTSKYGLIAGSIGLIGGYTWWHLSPHSCPLTKALGHPAEINPLTGSLKNDPGNMDINHQKYPTNPIGRFGKFEYTLGGMMRNSLPIGAFLLWGSQYYKMPGAVDNLINNWQMNWKPWLNQKLQSTHYRLMGGAYTAKADKIDNVRTEVTFDDLVGLDHVKSYFKLLVDYLENPESFDRQKLTPQKGCLLVGPTRTGKSFSVAALHGEVKQMLKRNQRDAKFEFIELPAALINREGISILLQIIKYHAPCVVFIDEIDLLNLQRNAGKNETLSEFLTSMSGALDTTEPNKQVIIIAATNKPENLDVALRQPGRFGKELRFEYPNFKERKKFLKHKFKKLSLNLNSFNIDKIARETHEKSYEQLKALIDHAMLKSRLNGQIINQTHIEETLDKEVRRVLLKDIRNVPEHEKQLLATHFAGHALALNLLNAHTKLAKVTIRPVMTKIKEELIGNQLWQGAFGKKPTKEQERYEYGSIFTYCKEDTVNMLSYDEKVKLIKMHLAGNAAEKLLLGSCSYSCHTDDKEQALEIALSIVFEGMKTEHLPKHIKQQRYDKALVLLEQCEQEVTTLLTEHKESLENIVQELKELGTMSGEEVAEIIDDTENQSDKK